MIKRIKQYFKNDKSPNPHEQSSETSNTMRHQNISTCDLGRAAIDPQLNQRARKEARDEIIRRINQARDADLWDIFIDLSYPLDLKAISLNKLAEQANSLHSLSRVYQAAIDTENSEAKSIILIKLKGFAVQARTTEELQGICKFAPRFSEAYKIAWEKLLSKNQ